MFSLHLPNASFVNLIDIFLSISKLHPHYFSCGLEHIRKMAVHIEHITNLPLRDRYNFCLVPVDVTRKVLLSLFVKGVRRYADNQLLTYDWLHHQIYHLLQPARDMEDLMPLNDAYDAVVMYLWLSYKFPVSAAAQFYIGLLLGTKETVLLGPVTSLLSYVLAFPGLVRVCFGLVRFCFGLVSYVLVWSGLIKVCFGLV